MRRAWPIIPLFLAGCATLRTLFPEPRPHGVPAQAIRIPGMEARLAGVAFGDFAAELARWRVEAEARWAEDGGPSPEELERLRAVWECWERPDMYDAWVSHSDAGAHSDGGAHYVVDIWPKPEVCLGTETETYGGGAVYEIDPTTFTIIKKEMSE